MTEPAASERQFVSPSIQEAGNNALRREIERLKLSARLTLSREHRAECRREARRLERILARHTSAALASGRGGGA
jgi:hypothetical protein